MQRTVTTLGQATAFTKIVIPRTSAPRALLPRSRSVPNFREEIDGTQAIAVLTAALKLLAPPEVFVPLLLSVGHHSFDQRVLMNEQQAEALNGVRVHVEAISSSLEQLQTALESESED